MLRSDVRHNMEEKICHYFHFITTLERHRMNKWWHIRVSNTAVCSCDLYRDIPQFHHHSQSIPLCALTGQFPLYHPPACPIPDPGCWSHTQLCYINESLDNTFISVMTTTSDIHSVQQDKLAYEEERTRINSNIWAWASSRWFLNLTLSGLNTT